MSCSLRRVISVMMDVDQDYRVWRDDHNIVRLYESLPEHERDVVDEMFARLTGYYLCTLIEKANDMSEEEITEIALGGV